MWSRIIALFTMLMLISSCGSARSRPAAQDKPMQVAEQGAAPVSAIQQLRMQAEKGNVEAQFALAQAYDRGRDVPKDKAEAVRWYQRAADQGDAFAQFALGNNYWDGTGIVRNEKEAVRWWHGAAAQGFPPAQHSLGKALATGGPGVPSDKIQAYLWLTLSALQGDQEADQQRATLFKQLKPNEIAKAKRLIKEWKPTRLRAVVNKSSP
jgi:TPR repeat protein